MMSLKLNLIGEIYPNMRPCLRNKQPEKDGRGQENSYPYTDVRAHTHTYIKMYTQIIDLQ